MKKFLLMICTAINSPIFDIIGGSVVALIGILFFYYLSELTFPCFIAFVSGNAVAIGLDCVDHGFARRKSSGSPDDNK